MGVESIKNNIDIEKKYMKEDNLFYVSNLTYNQMEFINSNKDKKNITINNDNSGMEVVKNIVGNILINNEKALILCDKEQSISDIYKSLIDSNINFVLSYSDKLTKKELEKEIKDKIDNLSKNTEQTTLSKINLLSKNIEKKILILDNIRSSFTKVRECGLTLLEMYATTEKKLSKYDERNRYYRAYKVKKPFSQYTYADINKSVELLNNSDILNKYIKYRRFFNNTLFLKLHENISESKLNEAIEKIDDFLENPKTLLFQEDKLKYLSDIKDVLFLNLNIDDETIKTLAQVINLKYNSNTRYNNKYNKLFNWFRKKFNRETEVKSKDKFNKLEKEIYIEIKETIKRFKLFLEQFQFLEEILSATEYDSLITKLLKGERIFDYLDTLKNTLNNLFLFNNIKNYFNEVSSSHMEILKYCYDNVENKKDMIKLLNSIPHLFLLLQIEEIELEEKDNINYYENYEIILNEINMQITKKMELIPKCIKYIWDNNLNANINKSNMNIDSMLTNFNNSRDSIFDFLNKYHELILNIFPCVILNKNNTKDISLDLMNSFDRIIECNKSENYTGNEEKKAMDNPHTDININTKLIFDNFFKKQLYKQLCKLGYEVKIDVKINNYYFPIFIYSKHDFKPLVAIEMDYYTYSNDYDVRRNDIIRRHTFEEVNKIYIVRLWSKNWWNNKMKEISKVQQIIETAYENIN